jgi:hypothetical protein
MFYVISVPNALKPTSALLADTLKALPGPRVIPILNTIESFATTTLPDAREPDAVGVRPDASTAATLNDLSLFPVLHTTILDTTLEVAGELPGTYKSVQDVADFWPKILYVVGITYIYLIKKLKESYK